MKIKKGFDSLLPYVVPIAGSALVLMICLCWLFRRNRQKIVSNLATNMDDLQQANKDELQRLKKNGKQTLFFFRWEKPSKWCFSTHRPLTMLGKSVVPVFIFFKICISLRYWVR